MDPAFTIWGCGKQATDFKPGRGRAELISDVLGTRAASCAAFDLPS